jgi:hypothetical protein
MGAILAFLLTPIGRLIAAGASVMLLVTAFGAQQRSIGRTQVVQASKIAGQENADKSNAHHADADKPGASGRVLKKYCRDC